MRRGLLAIGCGLALALTAPAGPAGAATGGGCAGWLGLTFDDGPSHYRTATLRTLRAARVPATFFDAGMRVAANPQFAGFEQREGHLVLNHTWDHLDLTTLTAPEIDAQVLRTEEVLRRAGAPMPFRLMRPPFGAVNDAVVAELGTLGYRYVNWDVLAADYDVSTTGDQIRDTIVAAFRPGLVILMHDGAIDSANGPNVEAALPQIIEEARAQGYCFGLLDETGAVVPASLPGTDAPIPEVVNPVPYWPLGPISGGLLPPDPYVIVS